MDKVFIYELWILRPIVAGGIITKTYNKSKVWTYCWFNLIIFNVLALVVIIPARRRVLVTSPARRVLCQIYNHMVTVILNNFLFIFSYTCNYSQLRRCPESQRISILMEPSLFEPLSSSWQLCLIVHCYFQVESCSTSWPTCSSSKLLLSARISWPGGESTVWIKQ